MHSVALKTPVFIMHSVSCEMPSSCRSQCCAGDGRTCDQSNIQNSKTESTGTDMISPLHHLHTSLTTGQRACEAVPRLRSLGAWVSIRDSTCTRMVVHNSNRQITDSQTNQLKC